MLLIAVASTRGARWAGRSRARTRALRWRSWTWTLRRAAPSPPRKLLLFKSLRGSMYIGRDGKVVLLHIGVAGNLDLLYIGVAGNLDLLHTGVAGNLDLLYTGVAGNLDLLYIGGVGNVVLCGLGGADRPRARAPQDFALVNFIVAPEVSHPSSPPPNSLRSLFR
jgi:hypothetical protein